MAGNFNIIQRLVDAAGRWPERAALVQPGAGPGGSDRTVSYHRLEEVSRNYAAFYRDRRVGLGDTALLLLPLGIDFYVHFLALTRLGAAVTLIDPGAGLARLRAAAEQVPPTVFVAPPQGHLLRLHPGLPGRRKNFSTAALPFATAIKEVIARDYLDFEAPADHPALMTFTSGSTGQPKGMIRSHGFLLRQGDVLAELTPAGPEAAEFCTFPVFVLSNLAQGVTTVLPPAGFHKAAGVDFDGILATLKRCQVNRLLAAPDFCARLARAAGTGGGLAGLKHIHTGGGPVHFNLLEALARLAPDAEIVSLYGSTEAEPIALQSYSREDGEWRERVMGGAGLPAGRPVSHLRLRVIRDLAGGDLYDLTAADFDSLKLPADEIGEIVVSGDLVGRGYVRPADDRETKINVEGTIWHRTGDAGYLDADGRLWLQGRCGARIEVDGRIVYPLAVEAAASVWPEVGRAALVEVGGRRVLALENGGGKPLSEQGCETLRRKHPYVDEVVLIDRIPVDSRHGSKVLYAELRARLARENRRQR